MSETGLKRRNVAAASQLNDSNRHSVNENVDSDANESDNIDEKNEEFDADSKSTRLTLMEEILLLGLKDKEVCFRKPIWTRFA